MVHAEPRALEGRHLSPRDRMVLAATRRHLDGSREDFREALRALTDAVMATIPNGRVYVLERAPLVLGSLVSGVGLVESRDHVEIVHVGSRGRQPLGRLRT